MTVCWAFAGLTLAAVLVATFVGDIRRAVLALWVAGLGVGAVYLTLGAEVLAVVQWIVSTLVAISFIFFSAMFGEYGPGEGLKLDGRMLKSALGVLAGAGFAWAIRVGGVDLPEELLAKSRRHRHRGAGQGDDRPAPALARGAGAHAVSCARGRRRDRGRTRRAPEHGGAAMIMGVAGLIGA